MKRRHQQLLYFGLLAGLFVGLLIPSWRRWPDVFVDFGLQLYLPWQLAGGKVLYRDVTHLAGGPLSQYFHAFLFRIFGDSFTVLIVANLSLLALFLFLLHRLFSRAANSFTAALICACGLAGFAFAQYGQIGNYNLVAPYTYETFHGLLLAVAAIGALWRTHTNREPVWPLAAGLCAGGVFLTKPDLFLALVFTLAASAGVHFIQPAAETSRRRTALCFLGGFLVPLIAFAASFACVWDVRHMMPSVAAAWWPVLTTPAAHNQFYAWCLGLDRPVFHLWRIVKYSGASLAVLGFLVYHARHCRRRDIFGFSLHALLAVLLYFAHDRVAWREIGCALLPLTALGGLFVSVRWWQLRRRPEGPALVFPLLWSVFALFLMAKMGFFTRLHHYGFYLALPAFLFLVFIAVWWLPRELERFGVHPRMLSASVTVLVAIMLLNLTWLSHRFYAGKTEPIGDGGDVILAPRAKIEPDLAAFRGALTWLKANTAPTNTLAVMPHGVLVNYLSRRANSTPYVSLTITELVGLGGESKVLRGFREHPPDYIALVHYETAEHGVALFGQTPNYGLEIMQWVRANYTPVWLHGHEPLQTNAFGIRILRHN